MNKSCNGDYLDAFADDTYEESLCKWLKIVFEDAKLFYEAQLSTGIGSAPVNVRDICYPPNRLLCDRAVINALTDIKRAREYHPIKNTELTKFAAYIGYWLTRSKPFMLKLDEYEIEPIGAKNNKGQRGGLNACFSVNEQFVASFMISTVLAQNIGNVAGVVDVYEACSNYHKENRLRSCATDSMNDSLCYYLEFRSRGAQELELFLNGLLTCSVETSLEVPE